MKCVTNIAFVLVSAVTAFAQLAPFATGQSARLVIGQPEFDAESDNASQTIVGGVSGLAYANDTLFVADANQVGAAPVNNRVLIYHNLSTQLPQPNAALQYTTLCPVCVGSANLVLGQNDWISTLPAPCVPPPSTVTVTTTPTTPACTTSSPQTPIATGMRVPTAIATDGTHLVVADTQNNRVLIWNSIPAVMNQAPDVVIGQKDFTTATFPGTPTASSLRGPQGVWIQNGKLYVADTQNDRVLIYNSIPTSNGASADVVLGQPNMTTWVQINIAAQNKSATAQNMLNPVSVTSDGTHLFVTDLGFNRVLIWNNLPSANQAAADVEIGQPDMTSGFPNNAYTTVTVSGTTTKESPVMCTVSNGVDSNSNPTYPPLCEYTLSFPRYALSDGTRLFVADGGNDRVLIYNSIPTSDGAPADIVLGQTDFVSDAPTDGADTMDAPLSLAWDSQNQNLYVADTYNQRILVYTPGEQNLPYNAVRNAASLNIYAFGTVTIGGTIASGDKVTVTLGISSSPTTTGYTYTIQSGDSFAGIVQGLVALINAGKGDPYAFATADPQAAKVFLTARTAGAAGNGVTLTSSISTGAKITAVTSAATLQYGGSAASIAPGSLVTFLGTNLSDQVATAPPGPLPLSLGGVEVYFNGVQSPLLFVSPTQINAQLPFSFEFAGTGTANAWVRVHRNDGSIVATNTVALGVVPFSPGIFAGPGQDPRPAVAYHSSNYATGVVSVDGTIKAGNIGSICIGSSSTFTATTTTPTGCSGGRIYNYTVQASDSLYSVQRAFVAMLQNDPQVTATASSEFTRIILQARTAGTAGNGIPFQVAINTGANLLLTAIGPANPSPAVGVMLCCASTAGAPITVASPAVPGETIVVYATGLGVPSLSPELDQDLLTGQPYQGPEFNTARYLVSATIDNTTANVLRAELAPGMIGIYQVYLQLNASLATDPQAQLFIDQNDNVNGTYFVSNTVTVPVFATPLLSSIACSPSSLNSGGTTTCTVVLSVAINTGTTTVNLSSDNTLLTVPASVSVEAGATSASFTATAGTITSSQTATVSATLGNTSTTTTVSLAP